MKFLKPFNVWIENNSINENIAAAKSYIQKKEADKLGKTPEELTPEEREAALTDRKYLAVIDLVKNAPGYAGAFVKFAFDQGINVTQLAELLNTLKTKKHIIAQLPKSIEQYAAEETVDRLTGFEKMQDDIRTIERTKDAKWFVDALPRRLRDQYRTLSFEDKAAVTNLAHQLTELGKTAIKRLFDRIKAFENWTIDELIKYTSKYIAGFANLEMQKKIDAIYSLEPEASIIYSGDNYLVLTLRTEQAQKQLCSIANWCINTGKWNIYTDNGIQINIFNFNTDPSDPMFLTGTTVYYTGGVSTASDINNRGIQKSENPREHFTKLGYPSDLVDQVINSIPVEILIKKLLTGLSINSNKPIDFLIAIIMHSYKISPNTHEEIVSELLEISSGRIKQVIPDSQIINMYTKFGVMSKFSAQLLKRIVPNITSSDLKRIKDQTIFMFKKIKEAIELQPHVGKQSIPANILAQEEEIMKELNIDSRDVKTALESYQFDPNDPILEFFMDGPLVKPAPTKTPVRKPMTPSRPSPIPSKQPFKAPEPAKAEAEDVLKRLKYLTDEEL